MANNKYKNKPISSKKLATLLTIVIGAILLLLYCGKWHQVKEDEKYVQSYLMSTNTINYEINTLNDINSVLSETPDNYFIYVSYTNDKNIYNFEKKLKPLVEEYNLQNSFYYLNITTIKEKNNYKKDIAKKLNIDSKNFNKIPVILYFKDSVLEKSVTTIKDFENLLKDTDMKNV